jgi:putative ABC transport system permease protein
LKRLPLHRLAWRYLWARPGVAWLNLGMLALGVAAIVFLTLSSQQLQAAAQRDLRGVDLVVGAKGSPLQLILAGVFHIDVPPGNIPLAAMPTLRAHPLVQEVVPISLGDSYKGWRIVGTEPSYLAWYGGELRSGALWTAPMQAVVGAEVARRTGLAPGAVFAGTHGLGEGGELHGDTPYAVVGTLKPCACVLDRLILTATESVWVVHEGAGALDDADRQAMAAERELTLLLVRYTSPLAAVTLPRWVNAEAGLQAAVPALESARLLRNLGVGLDVMQALVVLMLVLAALSAWLALMQAVREREADLAMLRMLGAPPGRVAALVLWEGLWLAALGLLLGVALGHGLTGLLGLALAQERSLSVTAWWWSPQLLWLLPGTLLWAAMAAALPAWRAARLAPQQLLQAPR